MRLRNVPGHRWLWSALFVAVFAAPAGAQLPSPLELSRGLREHGQVELALEYLKDLEGKPLSPDDKAAILLERAKCLLEASEEEPDEATRTGMVLEAREGLRTFLTKHPNHPRAVEARLTDAKLTAIDAKEQLNRARRMDIPPFSEDPQEKAAREAAMQKQKEEAKKARPLFLLAAKQFGEASAQLRARLDDKTLEPLIRKTLEREAFEAELASGINQFNTAETYMPASLITGAEKAERNKYLEQAKDTFAKLAKGPANNRTVWVARAWAAEVTFEQDDFNGAAAEVTAILRAPILEAEDGKRLARFFQLRRNFISALSEKNLQKALASETELRNWLKQYGNPRKPTPEVFAVRYYLARMIQALAESSLVSKDGKPLPLTNTARTHLTEAEKIYRALSQTDHEYTSRATRQRMAVVRRLLGDADQPLASFDTFEKAQMASLIQLSKLAQAEAMPEKHWWFLNVRELEIKNRQQKTIALLERSRELATPQDNPADVTDVLLRLIYYYQISNQPQQAAVLGEYGARTIKGTGGKAALAGLFSLNGYLISSRRAKEADSRRADRDRAIAMAKFLDEKFPNDNATDSARHQLASLYMEDKNFLAAFEILLKVRPNYSKINDVRLLEGYLAGQLVNAKAEVKEPLPEAKKLEIYRRALADLAKVSKPALVALEDDVRSYISARCRFGLLLFAQPRADAEAEKANPGYNQALAIAESLLAEIPTFTVLVKAEAAKPLNLDGLEMMMLAQDLHARATYLRARALIHAADDATDAAQKQAKYDEAAKTLQPILDLVEKNGPLFTPEMKTWSEGVGEDKDTIQKAKVAQLAGIVDKTRVDVILTGFRLKVKLAKAAEAEAMLALMVKAGGSIENSLPLLEPVARELAAQMARLHKEGKKAEADALGAGLAVLLNKILAVPNISQPLRLFLGQMLVEVGQCDKAIEELKKIPQPDFAGWQTKKPEDIPQELRGRVQEQIRNYALAQFGTARALRECKKYKEAEAMLLAIIGTADKPGWGSGRLYFRKELASLYEDWGATITAPKEANVMWGKALKEWTTLYGIQRNRLSKVPKEVTPQQMAEFRNAFADAFFDVNRCLVKANQQLLKAQPPDKIQKTYDDVAKKFADMEKQIPAADWQPEVQHRYAELIKDTPQIAAPYKTAGGKFFLTKIAAP